MNLDLYQRVVAGEPATVVLTSRPIWRLTGPDARRYINGQITNDASNLTDGQGCYAAVCTAKGRMEGDIFVSLHGADFYLDAAPELHESLGARLEKYLIADDAVFEDVSDSWNISHVLGEKPPPAPEGGFVISRSRFGIPGHDLWRPGSNPVVIGESLDADLVETLRLEQGIPRWSAELTTTTLPPEAGPRLLSAISYTKGCYVGQETIARLKSVGHVNRTLVFLHADAAVFPTPGTKIRHDGREVGAVTSSVFSPRLKRGIALAYVPLALAEENSVLEADGLKLSVAQPLTWGIS